MPLDPVRVAGAIRERFLAPTCAACLKYWRAVDRDGPFANCGVRIGECGGPMSGRDYPKYEGDIPALDLWCFYCGREVDQGVFVTEGPYRFTRVVGCCSEHLRKVAKWAPVEAKQHMVVVRKDHGRIEAQSVPIVRPTLLETIVQTEQEWARQDANTGQAAGG